jgi:hypothetical protein
VERAVVAERNDDAAVRGLTSGGRDWCRRADALHSRGEVAWNCSARRRHFRVRADPPTAAATCPERPQ